MASIANAAFGKVHAKRKHPHRRLACRLAGDCMRCMTGDPRVTCHTAAACAQSLARPCACESYWAFVDDLLVASMQINALLSKFGGGSAPPHPETLPLAHYATMMAECNELYPDVAKLRREATSCQAALNCETNRHTAHPWHNAGSTVPVSIACPQQVCGGQKATYSKVSLCMHASCERACGRDLRTAAEHAHSAAARAPTARASSYHRRHGRALFALPCLHRLHHACVQHSPFGPSGRASRRSAAAAHIGTYCRARRLAGARRLLRRRNLLPEGCCHAPPLRGGGTAQDRPRLGHGRHHVAGRPRHAWQRVSRTHRACRYTACGLRPAPVYALVLTRHRGRAGRQSCMFVCVWGGVFGGCACVYLQLHGCSTPTCLPTYLA